MSKEITSIASDFIEAAERTQSNDLDLEQVREERNEWKEKLEQLEEDDPLYEIAKENLNERNQEIESVEESKATIDRVETELLEVTSQTFIPRGDWTSEEVLRAVNMALLDESRDYININSTTIEPGNEISDDEEVFEIATTIRALAKEELNQSSELSQFWEDFKGLSRFEYFKVVATSEGALTGREIATKVNKEDKRQTISQTLINTTKGEFNPYFKQNRGEYSLSIVGEYLINKYSDIQEEGEEPAGDGVTESDEEATLDNF